MLLSLSVVIPAHNAGETIAAQLAALREQDEGTIDHVVVVDSFSTDDTVAVVEQAADTWAKIMVVSADRPGANAARNRGVAATSSDLIVLCDSDDVADGEWVASMRESLAAADVVHGRYDLELLNDPATIAARGPVSSTVLPASAHSGGIGGCCGFRRSAWEQLGGLDENHYGADDAEFFWRARLAGLRVGFAPGAIVNYRLRPGYRSLYVQQRTWAESRALLFREYRDTEFMSRPRPRQVLATWAWIVVHGFDARSKDPARRGRWVRTTAGAVGRVRGSVRHRVWFL